jgi:hypothetical protein
MIEISEAFYQWQQGRSKLKIAESLGISRPTLRNYLNLALASGFSVSSSAEEVAAIARSVQSAVAGGRIFSAPVRDAIALHEERIKKLLSEPDMTAKHVLATSLLHRSTSTANGGGARIVDKFIERKTTLKTGAAPASS